MGRSHKVSWKIHTRRVSRLCRRREQLNHSKRLFTLRDHSPRRTNYKTCLSKQEKQNLSAHETSHHRFFSRRQRERKSSRTGKEGEGDSSFACFSCWSSPAEVLGVFFSCSESLLRFLLSLSLSWRGNHRHVTFFLSLLSLFCTNFSLETVIFLTKKSITSSTSSLWRSVWVLSRSLCPEIVVSHRLPFPLFFLSSKEIKNLWMWWSFCSFIFPAVKLEYFWWNSRISDKTAFQFLWHWNWFLDCILSWLFTIVSFCFFRNGFCAKSRLDIMSGYYALRSTCSLCLWILNTSWKQLANMKRKLFSGLFFSKTKRKAKWGLRLPLFQLKTKTAKKSNWVK